MWISPFVITRIINEQNVEVKIKNRCQIYNMCHLKKFFDPESSKFKNEILIKKHSVDMDIEERLLNFEKDQKNENVIQKSKLEKDKVVKNLI